MKTEYKHIHFEDVSYIYPKKKTKTFTCLNNIAGTHLGDVQWNSPWRQYCFLTNDNILLAKSCLDDIGDFLNQLKK